ncbi:MAG TPA: type II toxin-antitoxin system VapC family toxin [Gammaproteobacteria bacterium]|nr:type II toxin-antitoxin system VapC family toxin [Gammaproteobacteria bacterium]
MILLDTHALIWWLAEPRKLSAAAKKAINVAAKRRGVSISAVSLFEIRRLIDRGRLELGIDPEQWFSALRSLPELDVEPVSANVAWAAGGFGASLCRLRCPAPR